MKSLITATAGLMILLAFLVQFTHSQMLHARLLAADRAVSTFRETVRQEGCISRENENLLQEILSGILNCRKEEVQISGDRQPVLRGRLISVEVCAPVYRAVALERFWNIKEEENRFLYQAAYTAASEYTGREP